jgi:hypothetical protein
MNLAKRFRAANGAEVVIPLPEPYSLPQPKQTAAADDYSTYSGRALAAIKRRQRIGQTDQLEQLLYDLACRQDERDAAQK